MKLTDSQKDKIVLKRLKRDLKNVEWEFANGGYGYPPPTKQHKKNIKMLQRAINFYSVTDEY